MFFAHALWLSNIIDLCVTDTQHMLCDLISCGFKLQAKYFSANHLCVPLAACAMACLVITVFAVAILTMLLCGLQGDRHAHTHTHVHTQTLSPRRPPRWFDVTWSLFSCRQAAPCLSLEGRNLVKLVAKVNFWDLYNVITTADMMSVGIAFIIISRKVWWDHRMRRYSWHNSNKTQKYVFKIMFLKYVWLFMAQKQFSIL